MNVMNMMNLMNVMNISDEINREQIAAGFVAPLNDLGLMAFAGEDAANFLHNQLSNDVKNLSENAVRLAGYCTPKGRLLATFLVWKTADVIFLQVPRDMQTALQKRLQMFIMRAKVQQTNASDSKIILGLGGASASKALSSLFPNLPPEPYTKIEHDELGSLLRLSDVWGHARYQWITNKETAHKHSAALCQLLHPVSSNAWTLSNIHAGVPQITLSTQEKWVPQMINFDLIGGINFKKGCYPGQEIVARSQYLGTQKRRMALATIATNAETPIQAGMEILCSSDPEQPCGMIVNAITHDGRSDCLVEIKLAALENAKTDPIHLQTLQGPVLQFMPLPYALQLDN